MDYSFSWEIKDGTLSYDTGRLIVFRNKILRSNGPSRDHNDLITSFAAAYRMNRSEVASGACRFYWKPAPHGITVSPVRKIDEDWVYDNTKLFDALIDQEFG